MWFYRYDQINTQSQADQANAGESGFSLVELMITVAIIGILATIATPNVQIMAKKAKIKRVKIEVASIVASVKTLKSLYGFYPSTNTTWTAALPYAAEYPIDCMTVSYGLGADQDQAMRDICGMMSVFNPAAQGLPAKSPVCGEPRDYLYISNGTDFQVMGYCFENAELLSDSVNSWRCGGGLCWGVSMQTTGGTW